MITIRTPFDIFLKLCRARNVGAIEKLLSKFAAEFADLGIEEKAQFEYLLTEFERWRAIELVHGPGAMLNLHDPRVQRLHRLRTYLLIIPQEYFNNAQKYQGFPTPT